VEIFRRYKLVIKIINSTVLNKLKSYSRISALGQEGHCTSPFKRAMCISCRPHVDVHKGGLAHVDACGQEGGQKSDFGRHKWMAPYMILHVHIVHIKFFRLCNLLHCNTYSYVKLFIICALILIKYFVLGKNACTDMYAMHARIYIIMYISGSQPFETLGPLTNFLSWSQTTTEN